MPKILNDDNIFKLNKIEQIIQELRKEKKVLEEQETKLYDELNTKFRYASWLKKEHPERIKRDKWKHKNYDPVYHKLLIAKNKLDKLGLELRIIKEEQNKPLIELDELSINILKYIDKEKASRSMDIYVNIGLNINTVHKGRYRLQKLKKLKLIKEVVAPKFDIYRAKFKGWNITEKGIAELRKRTSII